MKTWFVAEATASASPHGLCNAACKGVPSLCDMLVGNMPGCIGEVSAAALAIGAIYLLWRKVITWHIPVSFIVTVFVYSLIAGGAPATMQVLTGGVMIGACFMATDYVTSPITAKGKLVDPPVRRISRGLLVRDPHHERALPARQPLDPAQALRRKIGNGRGRCRVVFEQLVRN